MRTERFMFLYFFCIKRHIGTQGDVCRQLKIILPPVHAKAVVLVLFLFCVALRFTLRGASCFKVFPCSLPLSFFIPFIIVITSLGEEGVGLCASRAFFVCFIRVSVCHFSLPLGIWCLLRLVIMALPGLFY